MKSSLNNSRQTIYVEKEAIAYPRSQEIIKRFKDACVIECDNYREVFNPKRNNFRLQKKHPALVLATKHKTYSQPSPYGIGGKHNFYFSHMLNCIYDCSYCFLQALYSSAHYVVFVNYEDFFADIQSRIKTLGGKEGYFFSGYDCDSLAYEPVTRFVEQALPLFAKPENSKAYLELRTKSIQTKALKNYTPLQNCIVAFSLTPTEVAMQYEKGVPSPAKRIAAKAELAKQGWPVGARLDPLIWHEGWQQNYRKLIGEIAAKVKDEAMHSITLGTLRYPQVMAKTIRQQHPGARFLAEKMITTDAALQMNQDAHAEMMEFCTTELAKHYAPAKIIPNEV